MHKGDLHRFQRFGYKLKARNSFKFIFSIFFPSFSTMVREKKKLNLKKMLTSEDPTTHGMNCYPVVVVTPM